MSTALIDAMEQAQQAYQAGDYRAAAESSSQIADQFPHYLAAHRLLGLASLKQGRTAEAERALSRVLGQDPCDPAAYLGLSMIHEERGVLEHALAYSQVAWELAPTLSDYRQAIERVASMRYGSNGRLQLTHAALANLHIHNQRLRRAVREFETALLELPDRIDLRLGLATILWRLGEDTDAAALSRDLLEDLPDLARALVILADIEHREGNDEQAAQYLERLRRVDQDGRLVASMVEHNERADAGFLLLPADAVPSVDIKTDRVVAERPTIAPAPDFTYQEEEQPVEQDLEDIQPLDAAEFSDESEMEQGGEPAETPPDLAVAEQPTEEDAVVEERAESLVAELEQMDAESAGDYDVAPQSAPGMEADTGDAQPEGDMAELEAELSEETPAGAGYEDLAAQFDETDEAAVPDLDDSDMADLLAEFEGIEPMSAEDFGASEDELSERGAGMFQDAEIDFDIQIEDDSSVQFGGGSPPATFQPPAAFGDREQIEPDEFPEFPDVEEGEESQPAEASAEPEAREEPPPSPPASQPRVQSGTGYTRLLGELGEEGLAPFDPVRTSDTGAREEAPESSGGEEEDDPLARLAGGWDEADEDIASAIPTSAASTDELEGLEDLDLEPFDLDEEDQVESEVPARPEQRQEQTAVEPTPEQQPDDADFGDLEPFSFDDFEDAGQEAEEGFNFGRLPWEHAEGDSALPSDEALEAMLASEIEEERAADEAREPEATEPELAAEPELEPAHEDPASEFEEMADSFEELDASMAVTREFGPGEQIDPELESDLAGMEAAAEEHLEEHREHVEPYEDDDDAFSGAPTAQFHAEQVPDEAQEELPAPAPEADFPQTDADRLVQDDGIFDRSRSAKTNMVSEGVIQGDRELVQEEPAAALEPEEDLSSFEPDAPTGDDQFTVQTGATGDINTLRASIQADPQDPELHWWLGEALRKAGHYREAIDEYRWLIQESPGRYHDVIGALNACAEVSEEEDLAHRLIADVYRRLGDNSQARNHAALALAARRRKR